MPKARLAIRGASFDPSKVKMLGGVLDGVWASIAAEFGDDAHEIEEARLHLATVIIELACDHQLSAGQIARTAERLMREEKARAISDR